MQKIILIGDKKYKKHIRYLGYLQMNSELEHLLLFQKPTAKIIAACTDDIIVCQAARKLSKCS